MNSCTPSGWLFACQPLDELHVVSEAVHDHRGFQAIGIGRDRLRNLDAFAFDFLHECVDAFYFESESIQNLALVGYGRSRRCAAAAAGSSEVYRDPLIGRRQKG